MSKLVFTNKEFVDLRISAEESYKKIVEVFCPALKSKVAFNAMGLDHIKMKRWNHARERKDQFIRLKYLHLVPEIVKTSRTIQGKKSGNKIERIKINSRWDQKMVLVTYYEFISIVNECRLRIVIKQIDNGPLYFWSIVPYWRQGDGGGKKMFEGNPEED